MGMQVVDNFQYSGKKPLDSRLVFKTIQEMVSTSESALYDGCLSYVTTIKKYYTYDSNNIIDETLGKWRLGDIYEDSEMDERVSDIEETIPNLATKQDIVNFITASVDNLVN